MVQSFFLLRMLVDLINICISIGNKIVDDFLKLIFNAYLMRKLDNRNFNQIPFIIRSLFE